MRYHVHPEQWIIPARAGFTLSRGGAPGPRRDHPRSRGVYPTRMPRSKIPRGSSPLARGLPDEAHLAAPGDGIIPARAGFTSSSTTISRRSRDHPRSRGVYSLVSFITFSIAGSSPLARGLRPVAPPRTAGAGIIPARAGFTGHRRPVLEDEEDHPRSRGVYGIPVRFEGGPPGSSPLARGLRWEAVNHPRGAGIIPARAGFTLTARADADGAQDHPRSRGVYFRGFRWILMRIGSSPLARGLLGGAGITVAVPGIIPARAGFTSNIPQIVARNEDHPRSRGVYWICGVLSVILVGSSPLARGLRRR